MEATIKDLRLHTRELIAATDRGEEVIITYRGKRRAKLITWNDEQAQGSEGQPRNPAFGLWRNDAAHEKDVATLVRGLRQPRDLP
ncbi:type II toxin-antitoxin system Phd/YefM family antitoxin [Halomonas sp. WWR20]